MIAARLISDTMIMGVGMALGLACGLSLGAAFVVALMAGTVINFMVWAEK